MIKSLRHVSRSLYNTQTKLCLSSSSNSINIFNDNIKKIQRERAISHPDSHLYDYVKEEIAYRVADRVFDIKRYVSSVL